MIDFTPDPEVFVRTDSREAALRFFGLPYSCPVRVVEDHGDGTKTFAVDHQGKRIPIE